MTGLVFMHGWGFGAHAWQAWAAAFPERPVILLDAGYYGTERLVLPENPEGWVGIGHSLGFAKLLGMDVPWRGLVGLGTFLRFCSQAGQATGTPLETLDAMLSRLETDPSDVLTRFLRRCGLKGQTPALPTADGLGSLRHDLHTLRSLDLSAPGSTPPILLLHAADDRIAPLALAQEAREALPGATLHVFETGGHALPFTRTGDCLPLVREFVDAAQ
ncbi:MAG TPA: alpha/beta hydrolase [Humidesulfovibrio sp.]|uniref:alpha/beta fold hydrolase n=1 Tax=Humidesulfovibrio sp. TaxID=2910988 RepID=UPI002BEAF6EB|nr:alpha/beta hydrolase [Humidesulfovibrio sp.]HWR04477.1 alpha/beta hydrolase [Humidesulfovibrio sp.]